MSNHYSEPFSGDDSALDYETSWARISLDFGPRGYELAEEIAAESQKAQGDPAERIRREIQQMIEAVRGGAQNLASADEVQKLDDMELTAEIFEQLCQGQTPEDIAALAESEEPADSCEALTDTDTDTDARADSQHSTDSEPTSDTEGSDDSADSLATHISDEEDNEHARAEAEMERRITEATAEDVVRELLLAAVDLPQLLVYESDETTVDVYVLCIHDGDELLTAEVDEDGTITTGQNFELFAADLMELLPTRGGICADQESYTVSAPVTEIGEELTVDADARCAALVEISMNELASQIGQVAVLNPVETAPARDGWVLLTSDAVSMVSLLSQLQRPSLVVSSTESSHQLSFLLPQGVESEYEEGSVGRWMQQVVGTPSDDDSGLVIDLFWGSPKVLTRYIPQGSVALDALWLLPGMLPEPLNYVRINDEIENLTWLYNLDGTEAKRLRNYIEDTASDTSMESVLQLLGHTIDVARVADDRADISMMPGYRSFEPDASAAQPLVEAVAEAKEGKGNSQELTKELTKRPWLFVADSAAQLGASGVLAVLAARKHARGDSARGVAFASAALASVGVTELVVARAFNKLQKQQQKADAREARKSQIPKYLNAPVEPTTRVERVRQAFETSELGSKVQRLGQVAKRRTKSKAQKFLRKFLGDSQ